MSKKTYITPRHTYFDIRIGKKRVIFKGGKKGRIEMAASFSTRDEELQKGLEAHPRFGKTYIIDKKAYPVEKPKSNDDIEAVHGLNTAQEVREYLKKEKGASNEEVKNTAAIDAYCKKAEIAFPDWEH